MLKVCLVKILVFRLNFSSKKRINCECGTNYLMVLAQHTPLQSVWNRFEPSLQDAIYGTFVTHKIISTRKAFAALQGINSEISNTFTKMKGNTVIPLEGQSSSPNNGWQGNISFFEQAQCSPCVNNTCTRLANETEGTITSNLFFTYLVDTSCGPTVKRWREDGYNSERITRIFRGEEYYD